MRCGSPGGGPAGRGLTLAGVGAWTASSAQLCRSKLAMPSMLGTTHSTAAEHKFGKTAKAYLELAVLLLGRVGHLLSMAARLIAGALQGWKGSSQARISQVNEVQEGSSKAGEHIP